MLKKITVSFALALQNIRSHFFHTILSVLGIVIGVASLVSILSLIDGMEKYAKDQITYTTSLKAISIRTDPFKRKDGVTIRKDSVNIINYKTLKELESSLTYPARGYLFQSVTHEINIEGDTASTATNTTGVAGMDTTSVILHGRKLSDSDFMEHRPSAVLSKSLAKSLAKNDSIKTLIGKKIKFDSRELTIIGIFNNILSARPDVFFPITLFSDTELKRNPPACMIEAENVEDVPKLKDEVVAWLNKKYAGQNDFSVVTNEMRVAQATKGFKLFRIIMGLIVGISVLVGGIGVMNVLLISVTERTVEIGIRKAVGANKRDIVLQFLSESITISFLGSFIGLVTGVLGTMLFVPIITALTEVPFQAAYTLDTFIIISILAIVVGVVFGTYPAMRAARLDPVEAIRRE